METFTLFEKIEHFASIVVIAYTIPALAVVVSELVCAAIHMAKKQLS